jgi:hypothetical protein
MYQYQQPQPVYYGPQYSGCVKFLLYALSFFIPIVGIIAGVIFMSRPDPESKRLGQTCLILGIISIVLTCCVSIVFGVGGPTIMVFLEEMMPR